MGYATQQDLSDRFGASELAQLTDRTAGTTIDVTVVARALSDADAEIDAYLGARYALPLTTVPSVLARVAADIARYRLHEDRATESVRTRYEDAVTFLKRVAAGDVQLGNATPLAANTQVGGGNAVAVRSGTRALSGTALSGY